MSSTLLVYPDSLSGPYHFKMPTKSYFAEAFFDHDGSGGGPGALLAVEEVAPVVDRAVADLEKRVKSYDSEWAAVIERHDLRPLRRLQRSLRASQTVTFEWLI